MRFRSDALMWASYRRRSIALRVMGCCAVDPCRDCSSAEKKQMSLATACEDKKMCVWKSFSGGTNQWYEQPARSLAFVGENNIVHASGPLDKANRCCHVCARGHSMAASQRRSSMTRASQSPQFCRRRRVILAFSKCDDPSGFFSRQRD
jgi:hypothetical protein